MDPSGCIAILKKIEDLQCIKGNAEHYVLTPDLDAFPHSDEALYPDLLEMIRWWQKHMSQADVDFIRNLPDFLHLDNWYMVHDSPSDREAVKQVDLNGIDEKYRQILFHGAGIPANLPSDQLHQILGFMDEKRVSVLFAGHTHEPYIRHVAGKVICNLGSVGFTLDGDPRSSWVVCEQDGMQQNFTIRRVAYDIDQAIHHMMKVGFMDFVGESRRRAYIKMLQTGIHWRFHI
jgi:diadenosine tetraphosphatase ApaH/serine/threonine PP2A family protein phosphatase